MARLLEIVFDCSRPSELARFWAAVLDGYAVRAYDAAEMARLAAQGLTPETDPAVLVDGPGPSLCFQQAAERKTRKNRVHLDVAVPERQREVERLVALGASRKRVAEDYTVMCDPEGNEFCVTQRR
jgi:Glyoxalase-like domain